MAFVKTRSPDAQLPLNTMRRLAECITEFTFDKAVREHASRERVIFRRVFNLITPDFEKRAKNLPKEWFNTIGGIWVNAAGWNTNVTNYAEQESSQWREYLEARKAARTYASMADYSYSRLRIRTLVEEVRAPASVIRNRIDVGDLESGLADEIQSMCQDFHKLSEKADAFYGQSLSLLKSLKKRSVIQKEIPEIATIAPWLMVESEVRAAVSVDVKTFLCQLSSIRGEPREGCGETAENDATALTQSFEIVAA